MATACVISQAERLEQRERYGDLMSLHESGMRHLEKGELDNAWSIFSLMLSQWARAKFIEHSGKTGSPIRDMQALLTKLNSAGIVDRWILDLLRQVALKQRPKKLLWIHADILAAFVRIICFSELERPRELHPAVEQVDG